MTNKWYEKAIQFTKLGRHNVALHCWERATEDDPTDAQAWANRGLTLQTLGRYEESIVSYDKAIEIDPSMAGAWYNKGAVLGNLGNYRRALGCFEEATRQGHPSSESAAMSCREELGEQTWVKKKTDQESEGHKTGKYY